MTNIRRGADGQIEAFKCRTCDQWHDGPVGYLGADAPDFVWHMSEEDREKHLTLTSDHCVLEQDERTDYLICATLEIPVIGRAQPLGFGVWTSLSEKNFERTNALWETPGRESEEPYFAWLCTRLPGYPDTMFLKTWVQTRPVGERPSVMAFEPTDHPLVAEQRDGITVDRLLEIVEAAFH